MRYIISLCLVLALFVFLPGSTGATVSINILTPQKDKEISDQMIISADIKKDDMPFLETPGLRWASGVIKDSRGVEVLRISLRDNGKGEDSKPNDGIWTSVGKIGLAEGEYSVFIVLRENDQIFSSTEIKFRRKTEPSSELTGVERDPVLVDILKVSKEVTSTIDTNFKKLDSQLLRTKDDVSKASKKLTSKIDTAFENLSSLLFKTNDSLKWIFITMIITLILIGSVSYIIIKNYFIAKKPIDTAGEFTGQPGKDVPTEKWRPVFSALENIGKEISQMQKDVSDTFSVHRKYKENFRKIVTNIVSLFENIKDLKEIPQEHFSAFKSSFAETFETVGVERWAPEIGAPVPDGCNQQPATQDYPYPEGTVVNVLSPGYRIKENGGYVIVIKPTVLVAGPKKL